MPRNVYFHQRLNCLYSKCFSSGMTKVDFFIMRVVTGVGFSGSGRFICEIGSSGNGVVALVAIY